MTRTSTDSVLPGILLSVMTVLFIAAWSQDGSSVARNGRRDIARRPARVPTLSAGIGRSIVGSVVSSVEETTSPSRGPASLLAGAGQETASLGWIAGQTVVIADVPAAEPLPARRDAWQQAQSFLRRLW